MLAEMRTMTFWKERDFCWVLREKKLLKGRLDWHSRSQEGAISTVGVKGCTYKLQTNERSTAMTQLYFSNGGAHSCH